MCTKTLLSDEPIEFLLERAMALCEAHLKFSCFSLLVRLKVDFSAFICIVCCFLWRKASMRTRLKSIVEVEALSALQRRLLFDFLPYIIVSVPHIWVQSLCQIMHLA